MRNEQMEQDGFERRAKHYVDFAKESERAWQDTSIAIVLRFTSRMRAMVEEHFGSDHVSLNEDGSLLVRATLPENEWVYGMLLGYGPEVEILEPLPLRRLISQLAAATAQIYAGESGSKQT